VRRRQHRAAAQLEHALALGHVAAGAVMEFGAAHRMLELFLARDLAEERVGRKQHAVVEKNVVDSDHAGLMQRHVVGLGRALEHLQAQGEVRVVIKVGAGRDHPVNEAVFD
jgi:hypothetical protein